LPIIKIIIFQVVRKKCGGRTQVQKNEKGFF